MHPSVVVANNERANYAYDLDSNEVEDENEQLHNSSSENLETDAESKNENSRMVSSLHNVVFILDINEVEDENEQPHNSSSENLEIDAESKNENSRMDSNEVEDENEQPHNSSSENLEIWNERMDEADVLVSGGSEVSSDLNEKKRRENNRKHNAGNDSLSGNSVVETSKRFKPSGEPYKDDAMTPVFSWQNKAYTSEQLVQILLGNYDLCAGYEKRSLRWIRNSL
ncbi:Hypothetical predicted protein [Paramuricea clavata]|uniref:Uncharacterized protein n=1 Tax=Paramuricea clavata TaxID=317549 RepID=A0A6S7JJ43_PARCT|nr:Hypothetical predicted protein [Paramuricea clavata]